jgi:YYY domain-containing protein
MEFGLLFRWLVVYATLFVVGLPVAARLLAPLATRGVGFALPVSLVLLTTGAYWVGHVTFGPLALVGGGVLLLAVAAVAALDRDALEARRLALSPSLRALDRRRVAETAAVFLAGFLFVVGIRAVDPAVYPLGGEKFLDFGLLKSLSRTARLPPEDVWFAGEPVQYYYGGHLMTTLLARLAATPPRFAYNLALAGFYASLVTAAYDLAGAIAAERADSPRLAGLLAVFFVGVASNLVTAGKFVLSVLPSPLREQVAGTVAAQSRYTVGEVLAGLRTFTYWDASRVIPGTINEFPLFAWLNGDLHAHMMGTPFLLLAAALGYSYYRTPESARTRRRVLVFVAVPVLGGLQVVVDTWSFPSVFGLTFLAVAFAPTDPWTLFPRTVADRVDAAGASLDAELGRLLGTGALVAAAGVVTVPYLVSFLLGTGGGREIALLAATERSRLGALALVHGGFLVAFYAYLLDRLHVDRVLPLFVALSALAVLSLTENAAVLLLVAPLLVFGWVALRMDRPVGYETVLVVAGAGLVTLVEFVYVKEQAGPLRMNTVFKTYMQVWVLWGTAMGAVLPAFVRWPGGVEVPSGTSTYLRTAFAVALVLSTALYAGFALPAHVENGRAGGTTLDATAFVEREHPAEAPAIRRLDRLSGQPNLLSAPATSRYPGPVGSSPASPGMYSWNSSPAASLTGIPTVAGWHHEVGYRGADAYLARVRDVDAIYTGRTDRRAALLRKYDVEYIWVGPAERARYGSVSFAGVEGVERFYETESVTIYRVT